MKKTLLVIILPVILTIISCENEKKSPENNVVACFELPADTVEVNHDVKFTNCSENSSFYQWNFGNSQSSSEENPTYQFPDTGTFVVTLLAKDEFDNSDLTEKTLYVKSHGDSIEEPSSVFKTYDDLDTLLLETFIEFYKYFEQLYLLDANYTNQINSQDDWRYLYSHSQTATDNKVSTFWNSSYKLINHCNTLEYYTENTSEPLTEIQKETILCNLKGVRAFVYLNLINWFGDVPLMTENPVSSSNLNPSRESIDKILAFIIEEANYIIDSTPNENILGYDYSIPKEMGFYLLCSANRINGETAKNKEILSEIMSVAKYPVSTNSPLTYSEIDTEFLFYFKIEADLLQESTWNFNEFIPVLSSSTLHLLYAESLLSEGTYTIDTETINKLLERNSLAKIDDTTTKSAMQEKIINLIMTDKFSLCNSFISLKSNDLAIDYLKIEEYKLLLPIPSREVNLNINMTQNPRY